MSERKQQALEMLRRHGITDVVVLTAEEAELALKAVRRAGLRSPWKELLYAALTPFDEPSDAPYPSTHKMTLEDEGNMTC